MEPASKRAKVMPKIQPSAANQELAQKLCRQLTREAYPSLLQLLQRKDLPTKRELCLELGVPASEIDDDLLDLLSDVPDSKHQPHDDWRDLGDPQLREVFDPISGDLLTDFVGLLTRDEQGQVGANTPDLYNWATVARLWQSPMTRRPLEGMEPKLSRRLKLVDYLRRQYGIEWNPKESKRPAALEHEVKRTVVYPSEIRVIATPSTEESKEEKKWSFAPSIISQPHRVIELHFMPTDEIGEVEATITRELKVLSTRLTFENKSWPLHTTMKDIPFLAAGILDSPYTVWISPKVFLYPIKTPAQQFALESDLQSTLKQVKLVPSVTNELQRQQFITKVAPFAKFGFFGAVTELLGVPQSVWLPGNRTIQEAKFFWVNHLESSWQKLVTAGTALRIFWQRPLYQLAETTHLDELEEDSLTWTLLGATGEEALNVEVFQTGVFQTQIPESDVNAYLSAFAPSEVESTMNSNWPVFAPSDMERLIRLALYQGLPEIVKRALYSVEDVDVIRRLWAVLALQRPILEVVIITGSMEMKNLLTSLLSIADNAKLTSFLTQEQKQNRYLPELLARHLVDYIGNDRMWNLLQYLGSQDEAQILSLLLPNMTFLSFFDDKWDRLIKMSGPAARKVLLRAIRLPDLFANIEFNKDNKEQVRITKWPTSPIQYRLLTPFMWQVSEQTPAERWDNALDYDVRAFLDPEAEIHLTTAPGSRLERLFQEVADITGAQLIRE